MIDLVEGLVPISLPSIESSGYDRFIRSFHVTTYLLGWLVGIWALYRTFRLIKYIVDMTVASPVNFLRYGDWAVITGCTDGIGKAYATELAKSGLSLVLISRTKEKLQDLAKQLKRDYHTQTKIIAVDFTNRDPKVYERIEEELRGLDVGVLFNNVGISYKYPEYYTKLKDPEKLIIDMVYCNIVAATHLTQTLLPAMIEKKKGLIVNISSVSALFNCPLLSVYAGTKAFIDRWSQSLDLELKGTGVTVQTVVPGYVATKLSGMSPKPLLVPSPETYVKSHLRTIERQGRTSGYWFHEIQAQFSELGQVVASCVVHFISISILKALRKQALHNRSHYKVA